MEYLKDLNIINYGLTTPANGIALCDLCYYHYNLNHDPGLAIVPDDLQYFINFELQDYERRRRAALAGAQLTRTCPTLCDYLEHSMKLGKVSPTEIGGLYRRVVLKPFQPMIPLSLFTEPKPWHGAPLAIIRRAFTALGTVRINQWPSDLLSSLNELRALYNRPHPTVDGLRLTPEPCLRTSFIEHQPEEKPPRSPSGGNYGREQQNSIHGPNKSSADAMKLFGPHLALMKRNRGFSQYSCEHEDIHQS